VPNCGAIPWTIVDKWVFFKYWVERVSWCQILWQIAQSTADVWQFFLFFKIAAVHRLGFIVCVWTTHEEHLVVLMVVQNLVGIGV